MRNLAQKEEINDEKSSIRVDLLIVAAIIVLIVLISALIHVFLRFLRRNPSRITSSTVSQPEPSISALETEKTEENDENLLKSLPIFTLSSALAAAPRSSADCAVCLSKFKAKDQLRLLPACRHAFHVSCIDTWLKSSRSCPLCRACIESRPLDRSLGGGERSRSFRVEIGSVSRRRDDGTLPPQPLSYTSESFSRRRDDGTMFPHPLSYSIGSSFHYTVEEEVEAVINDHDQRRGKDQTGQSWIAEYVDRFLVSASSSFSSLRFGGCGSRRVDVAEMSRSLRWEFNQRHENEEDAGNSFIRWLVGS